MLLTEGIQNLPLDGIMMTLNAITHGKLRVLMNLTRYPEQMREKVKKLHMKRATVSCTKKLDLRHTIIQCVLQQNRLGIEQKNTRR